MLVISINYHRCPAAANVAYHDPPFWQVCKRYTIQRHHQDSLCLGGKVATLFKKWRKRMFRFPCNLLQLLFYVNHNMAADDLDAPPLAMFHSAVGHRFWLSRDLTSHSTLYRSFRGRFLQARWPNQQRQSTEGSQMATEIGFSPTRTTPLCYNMNCRQPPLG